MSFTTSCTALKQLTNFISCSNHLMPPHAIQSLAPFVLRNQHKIISLSHFIPNTTGSNTSCLLFVHCQLYSLRQNFESPITIHLLKHYVWCLFQYYCKGFLTLLIIVQLVDMWLILVWLAEWILSLLTRRKRLSLKPEAEEQLYLEWKECRLQLQTVVGQVHKISLLHCIRV